MALTLVPERTIPGLYANSVPQTPSQSLINHLFNKYLFKCIVYQAHDSQRVFTWVLS